MANTSVTITGISTTQIRVLTGRTTVTLPVQEVDSGETEFLVDKTGERVVDKNDEKIIVS